MRSFHHRPATVTSDTNPLAQLAVDPDRFRRQWIIACTACGSTLPEHVSFSAMRSNRALTACCSAPAARRDDDTTDATTARTEARRAQ